MLGLVDTDIVLIVIVDGELGIIEDTGVECVAEVGVKSVLVRINEVVVLGLVDIATVVLEVVEGELGIMEDTLV